MLKEQANKAKDNYLIGMDIQTAVIMDDTDIKDEEISSLRPTTIGMGLAQTAVSVATGVVLGKGIVTGVCIYAASQLILSYVLPHKKLLSMKLNSLRATK